MLIPFAAETGEHNDNNAARVHADGAPAFWLVPWSHQRIFEKCFVEISKIQPVLFQVGEALRLVPNDFHDLIVVIIWTIIKYFVYTKCVEERALRCLLPLNRPRWL